MCFNCVLNIFLFENNALCSIRILMIIFCTGILEERCDRCAVSFCGQVVLGHIVCTRCPRDDRLCKYYIYLMGIYLKTVLLYQVGGIYKSFNYRPSRPKITPNSKTIVYTHKVFYNVNILKHFCSINGEDKTEP